MQNARRKFLVGLTVLLLAGLLIGWIYGRPLAGLLVATAVALGWTIFQLLRLEKAISSGDLESVRYGEGIWSLVISHIDYLKQRGDRYKKRHRQLLKEVRKSTNALPDGAILLNADLEIIRCNSAAARLVGFRRRKDRGQRADNLLRDPAFTQYLHAGDHSKSVEIESPLNEDNWLNCRLVPYGEGQHLLLIRDVTERIRINKTRREFVANASHELRSPLTVITGYLHALVEDRDKPIHWQKPVADMHQQAERMNKIVEELLELSRLEGKGQASIDKKIDVCGLLSIAGKAYAGLPAAPEVVIECRSNTSLLGNAMEIDSVISNLLSNALRHTNADGKVTLRWESDSDGGLLSVSDTGEGIDEADIPRLTERFYRVNRGRSRDDGGVGLGLAIVKHALGRHDAELHVTSEPGKGSTFACHFPPKRLVGAEIRAIN